MLTDVKSFHDSIKEVQKPGFCGRCGGCVSFCSADSLGVLEVSKDEDSITLRIPFEGIDTIARTECLVCPDFSAEYSDVSFGSLGSKEGYTTILIRSETGNKISRGALTDCYIEERRCSSAEKARSHRTKIHAKSFDS